MEKKYICIDIGGTGIKYGTVSESGEFLSREIMNTPKTGGAGIMEAILEITEKYLALEKYEGVCISTAGMVDTYKGSIFHAADTIQGYKGMEIRKNVMERFGIPCEVENDVNCVGLAESKAGAGKGSKSVLCLTIGTGIGGSMVINGEVLHGNTGSACEVGYLHMPGGAFEKLGAASILTKKVAERKGEPLENWNGINIFDSAKAGDEICIDAIDEMCDVLGMGIANICYIINPEAVVLGGGIMAQWEYLEPKLRAALDKYLVKVIASNTKLLPAGFGNNAGMMGAYYHFRAMEKIRAGEG